MMNMNTQKLKELATKAGFDVERLSAPHPGGFPREDMLALESFAELVIKECAEFIADLADSREPASTYSNGLKRHFEDEE